MRILELLQHLILFHPHFFDIRDLLCAYGLFLSTLIQFLLKDLRYSFLRRFPLVDLRDCVLERNNVSFFLVHLYLHLILILAITVDQKRLKFHLAPIGKIFGLQLLELGSHTSLVCLFLDKVFISLFLQTFLLLVNQPYLQLQLVSSLLLLCQYRLLLLLYFLYILNHILLYFLHFVNTVLQLCLLMVYVQFAFKIIFCGYTFGILSLLDLFLIY